MCIVWDGVFSMTNYKKLFLVVSFILFLLLTPAAIILSYSLLENILVGIVCAALIAVIISSILNVFVFNASTEKGIKKRMPEFENGEELSLDSEATFDDEESHVDGHLYLTNKAIYFTIYIPFVTSKQLMLPLSEIKKVIESDNGKSITLVTGNNKKTQFSVANDSATWASAIIEQKKHM